MCSTPVEFWASEREQSLNYEEFKCLENSVVPAIFKDVNLLNQVVPSSDKAKLVMR